MQTIIYIFPEIFLSLSVISLLMIGVFIKKSLKIVNILALLSLIISASLVLNQSDEIIKVFNDSYYN